MNVIIGYCLCIARSDTESISNMESLGYLGAKKLPKKATPAATSTRPTPPASETKKRKRTPVKERELEVLKQMQEDLRTRHADREERRKLQREVAQKTPEDAFFESCAMRVKCLPPTVRSIIQMQVQQLLYNAENPMLPQQVLVSLVHGAPQPPPPPPSLPQERCAPVWGVMTAQLDPPEIAIQETSSLPISEALNTIYYP